MFFSLNGVRVKLKLPSMQITRVIVQELPYHMPDGLVPAALSAFVVVKSVSFRLGFYGSSEPGIE